MQKKMQMTLIRLGVDAGISTRKQVHSSEAWDSKHRNELNAQEGKKNSNENCNNSNENSTGKCDNNEHEYIVYNTN